MHNFIETISHLKKGSVLFFAEGVSHNNIESLMLLRSFINNLKLKKSIRIYIEGPHIDRNRFVSDQIRTLDSGFNSLAFSQFYSDLYDYLKFIDVNIWEVYPNTLIFSDTLMTEYQKNKDQIIYERICYDMSQSNFDVYCIYFGINHSYSTWYDLYSKITYKRLYFFLQELDRTLFIIKLTCQKKFDYSILSTEKLLSRKLSDYKVLKHNNEYEVVLPSTAMDFPLIILDKYKTKKKVFRYPHFYKYKMFNYKFLSEKDRLTCINKFKYRLRSKSSRKQFVYELRLYFSFGLLLSDTLIIDSTVLFSFLKFVIVKSKYLIIFLNYLLYIFITRVKVINIPDLKLEDICLLERLVYKKRHLFMGVTENDRSIRAHFFYKLRGGNAYFKIPHIDEKKWCYKNIFSWPINACSMEGMR